MDKVFIDTDVILDFFFDKKPFSDYAEQVFGLCERGQIVGMLTPVIFSNLYHILRQNAKHEKVVSSLKQLLTLTQVLDMDKDVVTRALNSEFKDFEDSLQYFSAMKNGEVDLILTRNLKDFSKSEIAVMTPETYIKTKTNLPHES